MGIALNNKASMSTVEVVPIVCNKASKEAVTVSCPSANKTASNDISDSPDLLNRASIRVSPVTVFNNKASMLVCSVNANDISMASRTVVAVPLTVLDSIASIEKVPVLT